ncbi:MAG TPA: DUF5724 domain-containing protein [Bryobacteraceae bacterium]|nr:DUF5724 domain-containing protein [Bryobacteraceae bacterium]
MVTPEEAQSELKRHQKPRAREELEQRLTALPAELAATGLAVVDAAGSRYRTPNEHLKHKWAEAKRTLEKLDDRERGKLFAALFPPIAEHVEASWRLQMKLPYQTGHMRKAFRAPNHPAYTANSRCEWLRELLQTALPYNYDLEFLIIWAAHLRWGTAEHSIGLLLAAVLDSDRAIAKHTLDTLVSIVNGEHQTARIGRYAVTALLCCGRPEAWATVERLLLAAQRQEGLRQVVIESVDFAHPEAYRRMVRLIQQEKLSRFAAVARGAAVWFGISIDSAESKMIDGLLNQTLENLEHADVRSERVKSGRGESLYLALWATAFIDVVAATQDADRIAQEPDFERRYAAVHLLSQLGTVAALRILVQRLTDTDLRVALRAVSALPHQSGSSVPSVSDGIFAAIQELLPRMPEDQLLEPAIWEWNRIRARRAEVAAKLITYRGNCPFGELAPYAAEMDADGRVALLRAIQLEVKKLGSLKNDQRDLALALLRDTSTAVRELAFQTLQHAELSIDEAEAIEPLLGRKASDLRRGVMRLLLRQPVAGCRASIERLSRSSDKLMQQAAEELRSEFEPQSIPAASLQDGFGLFDPEQRTPPALPRAELRCTLISAGSERLAHSLDALIDKHRETAVTIKGHAGEDITQLLGNLRWGFGRGEDLPLSEVWNEWWALQKHELGGSAELELTRAVCIFLLIPEIYEPVWRAAVALDLFGTGKVEGAELRFRQLTREILQRRLLQHIEGKELTLLLDVLEIYANGLASAYGSLTSDDPNRVGWRSRPLRALVQFINLCAKRRASVWTREHWRRYWGLLRFVDEGVAKTGRECPAIEIALEARRQGLASEADIYDQLLTRSHGIGTLKLVTKRKRSQFLEAYPELTPMVDKCRDRIIEVELKRGDLPTAASGLVLQLSCVFGGELALTILKQLGKDALSRGWLRSSENRSVVFSHLLRVCLPGEQDTRETFANAAQKLKISRSRLVDLAVYAPQWARYVEHATTIRGLQEAALWLHAHTKDTQWVVDEEIRELWFAEVSERTDVPRHELLDGAVDVDWFRRMRVALNDKDWAMMLDSAKYASGGAGHKRAELFAAALTGEITRAELSKDITAKRNQDSVRALGLLPLPSDLAERRKEILARYEILQKFLRGSKAFGAQRQASEKLAYSIGLANLARTAGYPDSQRLSWTMEAEASADLRSGSIEAIDGVVRGVLSINALGEPELAFEKNGKALKDLPAAMKKSPALAGLRERKAQLAQQTSRMRESLEEAMIRGDEFTREELQELENHPLLKPMIHCLLFTGRDGKAAWSGALNGRPGRFRIAHPIDLLRSGEWKRCQQECLELTRIQPFKQAFRELYLLTEAEREQRLHSCRYEGQQVNPKQALAIVGKRGWVNVPEQGIRKTYHHDNTSAWVTFLEGWFTPMEVDGLTVQDVLFTNRADGKVISLDQVNERVFSEAMRDLDLMVSVAHRGGVDPEATASTTEMRAALIRETLSLLKITNVRLKERHAFVDGKIGAYNVHLGSGSVHRQPGGSLCIIPVHSQHRGRFFLPFADNDPKTAEVISKVLLLAQDDKIKDPTILEQLKR